MEFKHVMSRWDERFLELAETISSWSKDPSTQVGAVIVRPDRTVASMGFNGFPHSMPDHQQWLDNREEKYSRMIHAEINAVLHLRERANGYTIYTYPFMPCDRCMVQLAQSGIAHIKSYINTNERWEETFRKAKVYATQCGITLKLFDPATRMTA